MEASNLGHLALVLLTQVHGIFFSSLKRARRSADNELIDTDAPINFAKCSRFVSLVVLARQLLYFMGNSVKFISTLIMPLAFLMFFYDFPLNFVEFL